MKDITYDRKLIIDRMIDAHQTYQCHNCPFKEGCDKEAKPICDWSDITLLTEYHKWLKIQLKEISHILKEISDEYGTKIDGAKDDDN